MGFVQKTWKDRVAEYINRRTLTKEDGTTEVVTVARSEGTVSQEGDAFSAANMNDLEQRIADEFSGLTSSLNGFSFDTVDSSDGYYKNGKFHPFKKGGNVDVTSVLAAASNGAFLRGFIGIDVSELSTLHVYMLTKDSRNYIVGTTKFGNDIATLSYADAQSSNGAFLDVSNYDYIYISFPTTDNYTYIQTRVVSE